MRRLNDGQRGPQTGLPSRVLLPHVDLDQRSLLLLNVWYSFLVGRQKRTDLYGWMGHDVFWAIWPKDDIHCIELLFEM